MGPFRDNMKKLRTDIVMWRFKISNGHGQNSWRENMGWLYTKRSQGSS